MKTNRCGNFIVLEGPDGVGKTTQLELLRKCLVELGLDVVVVREPGGTVVGEGIRDLFKANFGQTDPMAEALLMLAARQQLSREIIRPALERGAWVISDRHTPSLFAYQGGGHSIGFDRLVEMRKSLGPYLLDADLTIFIRTDPEVRKQRLAERGELDKLDLADDGFKARVNAAYDCMIEGGVELSIGHVKTADGNGTPEEVHTDVMRQLFWLLRDTYAELAEVKA